MHTLGYRFRPWRGAKAIADGPSILDYVSETAAEYGVDRHIRYNHLVKEASWSSEDATLDRRSRARRHGRDASRYTCNFLFMCSRLLQLRRRLHAEFKGIERFKGKIVHPQKWPRTSTTTARTSSSSVRGATAMTLVPAMAKDGGHVTMLQRSPTYVVSRPDKDAVANWMRTLLPGELGLCADALEERDAAACSSIACRAQIRRR